MAGSVGTAYLTLVPKLDNGFAKEAESQMKGTGSSSSKQFSDGFNDGFVGTFKKLAKIGIVAKAGKVVGDTFLDAFNASARYEQLEDGVKKLFGDDVYKTVVANAKSAYATAGVDANTYMENVTSFSASLISSLGGDTAKAAEYADTALKDMSDNANTFGTDIKDIQNAYQGFAKQNYTMLDNLKLGYGGTKQEMQKLLDDAGKIAGVKFNIDSYADVIEAIHVMQESMEIAGTTYNEAATTVEGSITQMKAAWGNLMIAVGSGSSEEITETAQQLVDAFITAMGNIVPLAGQVMISLLQAVLNALGDLIAQGVIVLANGTYQVVQGFQSMFNGGVEAVRSFVGQFTNAAGQLIRGMVAGLSPSAVINKIKEICSSAVDQIKNFFGIHSPSTVMRDLFGYVGEGMALGLADSEGIVGKSMDDLLDSAYGKASSFGVGLNASILSGGRATNADVVRAINRLEGNLYGIIKEASPDAITQRQLGRVVRSYA